MIDFCPDDTLDALYGAPFYRDTLLPAYIRRLEDALRVAQRELAMEREAVIALEELDEDRHDFWADYVTTLEHTIAEMAAKYIELADENEKLRRLGTASCIVDYLPFIP